MSYKRGETLCTSHWILERSQARIGLPQDTKTKLILGYEKAYNSEEAPEASSY